MTLLELADACERAKGADGLLDENIAVAIGWQRPMLPGVCGPNYSGRNRYEWHDRNGQPVGFFPPAYTGSLDAAMQVVPDGWVVASLSIWPASPENADNQSASQSNCELFGTSVSRMARKMIWGHGGADGKANSNAKIAPLAICAAALRARHAMESE